MGFSGYHSKYKKRTEKFGGSIIIRGVCPAQLNIKIYDNGNNN
jgi:uncharacterized protein (DUF1330 family)